MGLERHGHVELAPHHPRWKRVFADEAHLIYDELRLEQLRLFHCGSTSIPGIAAKPIIDIVGSVNDLGELDERKHLLEAIGYEYKGEYGIPDRRYSVLYNPGKTIGYVHLHLFQHDHPEVMAHVRYRDYLRRHPDQAARYEAKKQELLAKAIPRSEYTEAKAELITELNQAAAMWALPPTKVLALLGSAPGATNTEKFLREIFGGTELEVVHLDRLAVDPYRYDAHYSAQDAFPSLAEKMVAADRVVFATPVYWYAMSGPMKTFFDRFSNLIRGEHKLLGEALYGKKVSLLSTGYDDRLPMGFEVPFASTAQYLGMDYLGAQYKSFK